MKRLVLLFLVFAVGMPWNVWAGDCSLVNCVHARGWDSGYANREMLTPDGRTGGALDGIDYTGQCFVCNNSRAGNASCNKNDKVAIITNDEIEKIYRCDKGVAYDSWEEQSVQNLTVTCGDSPLDSQSYGGVGVQRTIRIGDSQSNSSPIAMTGLRTSSQKLNRLCYYYDCDENHALSPNSQGCVTKICDEGTLEDVPCSAVQVDKHAGTCMRVCHDNAWSVSYIYTCASADYECIADPDEPTMCIECKLSSAAEMRQLSCEKTGGAWDGDKCTCDASKNLKPTANNLRCACTDELFDWQNGKCVKNEQAALCEAIGDGAEFDVATRKCKCLDQNTEPDQKTKKCVETKGAKEAREAKEKAEREAAEKSKKQSMLKEKITSARSSLDKIKLDQSVWKNKDGNFNTARLASDSIAGVVLGTAGGVITSNIVKKNQIKGGFERLKCSIGGQTVAAFGDEFSVGPIQQ